MIEDPKSFAKALCDWYRDHKRDLPFRKTKDPYKIFLSELMLQQTRMETAVPYYERFLRRYPDVKTLAESSEAEVLKHWEGLGYYRRAKHILQAAKTVCETHNGVFPEDARELETLKGVGRYTARAIASIAFNHPAAAVDGNVMRVMSRYLPFEKDARKTKHMKEIERILAPAIEKETPSDFTQAMMELGALVCKKNPLCGECPLQGECFAHKHNAYDRLPVLPAKKPKLEESYYTFLVLKDGRYLLRAQSANDLLSGMHLFPQYRTDTFEEAFSRLCKEYDLNIDSVETLGRHKHIFSHKIWRMQAYLVKTREGDGDYYSLENAPALPTAHKKIVSSVKK